MKQEDKQLLFKDLCARLPYGVIVKYKSREKEGNVKITCGNIGYVTELGNGWWKECKPYLRPMSSMTEAEDNEWCGLNIAPLLEAVNEKHTRIEDLMLRAKSIYNPLDWFNANHFDYRGLIEKGLALEAPKDMY